MEENKEIKKQIPDMQIDAKGNVVLQTIDVPLKVNGEVIQITMQKLCSAARNKIRGECTQTKVIGGQTSVKVDQTEMQEKVLAKAIIKAPFEITLEFIKSIGAGTVDYLFMEYSEFAEPSEKKNI